MDTLVRDPFFTHMAGFFDLSFEELLAQKHPTAWGEFELSRISEDELFARFFRDGRKFDGPAFKQHVRHAYAWVEGMQPLLGELQAQGAQMHLLSNYPDWYAMCDDQLGVFRLVPPSFVSCHTGVRKPSAEAYLGPCRTLGVEPSQCLFIDDRQTNCSAAEALGMSAILFKGDVVALRAQLTRHGLLAAPFL
jgi:HAD superfamily hydrolase (TIGR01509 family)